MRNRLAATPGKPSFHSRQLEIPQLQLFASAVLNGGMVTQIDPVDLQENQVVLALNADCRYDVISRRRGSSLLTPTKPDSQSVIGLFAFKQFDGQIKFLRFTRDSIFYRGAVSWTEVVPATPLTATDSNRIHFLSVNDTAYFGNEVDVLQKIDFGANTCDAAGNAKAYKYYCAFGNRIVGANLGGGSPSGIEVGWSGDFNFDEWDPLVDISAGFTPLIDNPSDYADFITGLFAAKDTMLVMRERSIVQATLQPIASYPFYFKTVVPHIGCDTPSSIAQVPNGLAWYDHRLNNVFVYKINSEEPVSIGDPIRKTLGTQVENNETLHGGYDPFNDEYLLAIPIVSSSYVRLWKYNFKTQAWTYDIVANVASINALNFSRTTTTIDDLVGTIDDLVGFIDDISPDTTKPCVFYGLTDGDILESVESETTDAGVSFTTDIRSKIFKLNPNDGYVTQLHIEYKPQLVGNFTISYSKDNGETFTDYKTVSWNANEIGKRLTIVCNKNVRCRSYQWKITSTSGAFDIVEYSAYVYSTDAFTRSKTT